MKLHIVICLVLLAAVQAIAAAPDTAWTQAYPTPLAAGFRDLMQTPEGGYIICGSKMFGPGENDNDSWLVCTDGAGAILWDRTYTIGTLEEFIGMDRTMDGGYILAAYHDISSRGTEETGLMKVAANGDSLWCRMYDLFPRRDIVLNVATATDGGYFLVGMDATFVEQSDITIAKFDSEGGVLWARRIDRNVYDSGTSVVAMPDGGCAIAGGTGDGAFPSATLQGFLIRMDAAGNILWEHYYGGAGREGFAAVHATLDGGFIMAGSSSSTLSGDVDLYLVKADGNGDVVWERLFGDPSNGYAESVDETQDGGYIAAGFNGDRDPWLVRTDIDGGLLWQTSVHLSNGSVAASVIQTMDLGYALCTFYGSNLVKYGSGSAGYATLLLAGPPEWRYELHVTHGSITQFSFPHVGFGVIGSVADLAASDGWTALNGNSRVDFINTAHPLTTGSIATFVLTPTAPWTSEQALWLVGDSSGMLEAPLPVELLSFSSEAGDRSVTLHWRTASENQNDHFTLLRDHQEIAQVAGAGSSSSERHYRYADRDLDNGTTYTYTLVSVDLSGVHKELATTAVTPSAAAATITNYALYQNFPNPFNPTTQIFFDLPETSHLSLKVYNVTGQEVATLVNGPLSAGRHTFLFDASNLPSGIYLYRMQVKDFVAEKKMVLLK